MTAFEGATVVVTGGASGIGREICRSVARRGASVVIGDIDLNAAQALATELTATGNRAIAVPVDVSDEASVNALADRAYAEFKRVDVLCNNAGVAMRPFRAIWNATASDYRWLMEINYFGVINGLLAFLPRMRAQGGHGHIVNTSSLASLDTSAGGAPYAASKAAVNTISEALRAELQAHGDDISVTVLYPGAVETAIRTVEDRLRDPSERSSARGVEEYAPGRDPSTFAERIEPQLVGEMVALAVERDMPSVITHPLPLLSMQLREDMLSAAVTREALGHVD